MEREVDVAHEEPPVRVPREMEDDELMEEMDQDTMLEEMDDIEIKQWWQGGMKER